MHLPWGSPILLLILLSMIACNRESATKTAQGESPSSDSSKAIIMKTYRVPEDYQYILADLAYQRTRDPSFASPGGGKSVIWEPWPIFSLKALGLQMRDDYAMANRGGGVFYYAADVAGHSEFTKLNQSLGIPIQEVAGANQDQKQGELGGASDGDKPPF